MPKKKDGYCWGGAFQMNGEKVLLTDDELAARIESIADKISELKSVE